MHEPVNISVTQPQPSVRVSAISSGVTQIITSDGLVHVYNHTPAGAMNGVNATFTTATGFIPEKVEVFLNGIRLKVIDEYNTTGNNTIVLTVSPASTETLLIDYLQI